MGCFFGGMKAVFRSHRISRIKIAFERYRQNAENAFAEYYAHLD
jgi:hypothetical protein